MNKDDCAQLAKKFNTRTAFKTSHYIWYMFAFHEGFLDEICAHMQRNGRQWTDEQIINSLSVYSSRGEVFKNDNSLYRLANRRGLINKLFPKPPVKRDFGIRTVSPILRFLFEHMRDNKIKMSGLKSAKSQTLSNWKRGQSLPQILTLEEVLDELGLELKIGEKVSIQKASERQIFDTTCGAVAGDKAHRPAGNADVH